MKGRLRNYLSLSRLLHSAQETRLPWLPLLAGDPDPWSLVTYLLPLSLYLPGATASSFEDSALGRLTATWLLSQPILSPVWQIAWTKFFLLCKFRVAPDFLVGLWCRTISWSLLLLIPALTQASGGCLLPWAPVRTAISWGWGFGYWSTPQHAPEGRANVLLIPARPAHFSEYGRCSSF